MGGFTPSEIGPRRPLRWHIADEGDLTHVELRGEVNENVDLEELLPYLGARVRFDLQGIVRINSSGVREWVELMRAIGREREVVFVRCSSPVVGQLNAVYNFRGHARVESFWAPYLCEQCQRDDHRLLTVACDFVAGRPVRENPLCNQCGGPMVLDDLPERYFAFLSETIEGPR